MVEFPDHLAFQYPFHILVCFGLLDDGSFIGFPGRQDLGRPAGRPAIIPGGAGSEVGEVEKENDMISIDDATCDGCGICAKICHEQCIAVSGTSIKIEDGLCSTCGQCIAVCPRSALSWDGTAPAPFEENKLPSAEQMAELFGQRRTIRIFKDRKLERALLEEIVGWGVYAPTHNFNLRTILIDDDAILGDMDRAVMRFSRRIYFWIFKNPVVGGLALLGGRARRNEFQKARPKLEHSLQRGRAYASPPAAMILVVGEKSVPLSLESAQYAIYNMNLYALTRGMACRNLVGNQMIWNRSGSLRHRLGIGKREKIFAAMAVGWPGLRFRNKVLGKKMKINWNGKSVDSSHPKTPTGETAGDL
jgi:ferredoxin/nitroreductase